MSPSIDINPNKFQNQPPFPILNSTINLHTRTRKTHFHFSHQINQFTPSFCPNYTNCHYLPSSSSSSSFFHSHMMNSLQFRYVLSPNSTRPQFSRTFPPQYNFPANFLFLSLPRFNGRRRRRKQGFSICCSSKTDSQIEKSSIEKNDERPPFDINLAVILAGFAFEAYTTPPVCSSLLVLFCLFIID